MRRDARAPPCCARHKRRRQGSQPRGASGGPPPVGCCDRCGNRACRRVRPAAHSRRDHGRIGLRVGPDDLRKFFGACLCGVSPFQQPRGTRAVVAPRKRIQHGWKYGEHYFPHDIKHRELTTNRPRDSPGGSFVTTVPERASEPQDGPGGCF
jgi:hypothetical protein